MLTDFHKAALTFMLSHPDDKELNRQIPYLSLADVEHTGIGCFYSYQISQLATLEIKSEQDFIIDGGMTLYANELPDGASMVLYVENGIIDCLEVLAIDSQYPRTEPTNFRFENRPFNLIIDADDQD